MKKKSSVFLYLFITQHDTLSIEKMHSLNYNRAPHLNLFLVIILNNISKELSQAICSLFENSSTWPSFPTKYQWSDVLS